MRFHTELNVDLGVLKENLDLLNGLALSNEKIFMIKADAYGHGLTALADFCWKEGALNNFGVASLGEAVELRKKLPSMDSRIIVFSDTGLAWEDTRGLYLDYNAVPVIGSKEDLEIFLKDRRFSRTPLFLKLDTGMSRLGICESEVLEAAKLIRSYGRSRINHLMTHFACSYSKLKEGDKTHRQYNSFLSSKQVFKESGVSIEETSCANSGAIEQGFALEESHVRPGLMLYGPASSENGVWKGRNVSSLTTNVLRVFPVKKGTPVGYGGHVVHKDGMVIYLPIGYGDGFLTTYAKTEFQVEGAKARALGRVNMDLVALFFDTNEGRRFRPGQSLKLWDHDRESVSELAKNAGVVPYQIFTAISSRIPRKYRI